jgi:hypothetical protein
VFGCPPLHPLMKLTLVITGLVMVIIIYLGSWPAVQLWRSPPWSRLKPAPAFYKPADNFWEQMGTASHATARIHRAYYNGWYWLLYTKLGHQG